MGLIKLAKLGAGFEALQRIGLGQKAAATYGKSSWFKDSVKKVVPNGVSEVSGLQKKILLQREAFLGGSKGSKVIGNKIGQFSPLTVGK